MSRLQINTYACKLRLLQYGLVKEAATVGTMEIRKGKHSTEDGDSDSSEDEDDDDLIRRRNAYVRKCISESESLRRGQSHMQMTKNPVAAEMRRNVVRDFLKDVANVKKCASCSG